jgi:hypothetical protein
MLPLAACYCQLLPATASYADKKTSSTKKTVANAVLYVLTILLFQARV